MNDLLQDLVAHNAWATRTLLEACTPLDETQLSASIPGSFGDIRETFMHFVAAERWYLAHLTGEHPGPEWYEEEANLDWVSTRFAELDPVWQQVLSEPIDIERVIRASDDDGGAWEFTAGVVIAQIFNHANEHREQICAIMTEIGIQPPEIDGWNYSAASGRGWRVEA